MQFSSQMMANVATFVAAVCAVIAIVIGSSQFQETQKLAQRNLDLQAQTLAHEREIKAYELFLKFNEQLEQVSTKPIPSKGEAAYWRSNGMLGLTEAIFRLTKGDPGWAETVAWMVDVQRQFLLRNEFLCRTFDPEFVTRLRQLVPTFKCLSS